MKKFLYILPMMDMMFIAGNVFADSETPMYRLYNTKTGA